MTNNNIIERKKRKNRKRKTDTCKKIVTNG